MSSVPTTPKKYKSKILEKSPSKDSNNIIFPNKEQINPNNIKINVETEPEKEIKKNIKPKNKNSNIHENNQIKKENHNNKQENKRNSSSILNSEKSKKKRKFSDSKPKKKKVKISDSIDVIQIECWKQYNCDMSEITTVKKNSKYKCCYIM